MEIIECLDMSLLYVTRIFLLLNIQKCTLSIFNRYIIIFYVYVFINQGQMLRKLDTYILQIFMLVISQD